MLALRNPELLWFALIIPLALLWRRRRTAPAVPFAPFELARSLPRSLRVRLSAAPMLLTLAGLGLGFAALARPVTRVELPRQQAGIDILLCIDISSSMAALDLDPTKSRLALAKAAAAQFIHGRPHDRIGLIRFARYADTVCPLTLDHAALTDFLDRLNQVEADGPEDRTGIGTAVARAARVLRTSLAKSKVIILLTDGEENVASKSAPDEIGPLRAALIAARFGVRVYVIAAGAGKRDSQGLWNPLDTQPIQALARRTGGSFFAARQPGAIDRVYAKINAMEKAQFADPRFEDRDRFPGFVLAGLGLALLAGLLRSTALARLP